MRQLIRNRPITVGILVGLIATIVFVAGSIAAYRAGNPAAAGQVNVAVTQYEHYTDHQGILHYVGEVKNNGSMAVDSVNVALTLKDATGTVLSWGSDGNSAGTFVDMVIAPAQSVGFNIAVQNNPTKPTTADLAVTAEVADSVSTDPIKEATDLKVISDTIAAASGGYVVSGQVKNGSSKDCLPVHVVVTGYDRNGKVVDVADGYTSDPNALAAGQAQPFNGIPAGQTQPFQVNLQGAGSITRYSIAIHAYQK